MSKYVPFITWQCLLVAADAARNAGYWNVQDPEQLYGPLRAEPFEALGFACKRTAVRLTRGTATKEGLADADACLDALLARAPSGAKLGPDYYDVVPLLEVRALQYHAYGGYAVDGLMERLRAIRDRMDPGVARPAEARETIDAAVARYNLGARSGRTSVRTFSGPRNDPDKCPGPIRKPDASASLHVHHHMTFHGSNSCAAQGALQPTSRAWTAAKDLPVTERRQRVEAALLNITALAAFEGTTYAGFRGHCGRPGTAPRDWKASMDGSDPIDYVFYEPQLPPGAPVGQSRRIVWTTTVRHPAKFSLTKILKSPRPMDRIIGPDFLIDMILGANPAKRVRNSAYCESAPLRRSALPMLKMCGNRPGPGNLRDFNRRDLAAAKKRLSGFAVVMLLEHYAEGLLAFCRRLGWPRESCRIKESPKSHIGAPGALKAAASQTSFRVRRRLQVDAPIRPRAGARGRPGVVRAPPPRGRARGGAASPVKGVVRAPPRGRARAQGKAIPRISSHGLGAFMTAMNVTLDGFADVIDETQLSLELYFYARELNRADHLVLGLAPPGTGLLPPGEADVFAGRA